MTDIDPVSLEPTADLKDELLQARISEQEKDYITKEAQKLRISLSAFTRMMILLWKGEINHP